MNCILYDEKDIKDALLPLTYLRPIAEIRIGVWTISAKWRNHFDEVSWLTDSYLSKVYPTKVQQNNLLINGALCPDPEILQLVNKLSPGEVLVKDGRTLAFLASEQEVINFAKGEIKFTRQIEISSQPCFIDKTWKIFQYNGQQLRLDIAHLSKMRTFKKITDPHTVVYNSQEVYVGEDVSIRAAVIDAENGPVYIADGCTIAPGTVIRGPFAMLEHSHLSMGAKMRGDITIGPYCKVGGEVANSIFFGYSNKAHDGYLGNSVIAEWCNIGAGTNTSNMKNDYSEVKVWNYGSGRFESSGSSFCGLVLGDHSKCGINVMFNSGTTVGISSSIFNANYPRNFIPSFVKGGASGWQTLPLKSGVELAHRVTKRRNIEFKSDQERLFEQVFELSSQYRKR